MVTRASAWLWLAALSGALAGDLDVRHITRTNDVAAAGLDRTISWHAGESVIYDVYARRGTNVVDLTASGLYPVWYVAQEPARGVYYVISTGTVANTTSGLVRVSLTPAQAALPEGSYVSSVILYQPVGGTNTYVGTVAHAPCEVRWSPDATNIAFAGPFTNGYILAPGNVTVLSPESWPWLTSNDVQAGAGITVEGGTNGGLRVSSTASDGGATNLSNSQGYLSASYSTNTRTLTVTVTGLATGTPLYAETDLAALAALGVASGALNSAISGRNLSDTLAAGSTVTMKRILIKTNPSSSVDSAPTIAVGDMLESHNSSGFIGGSGAEDWNGSWNFVWGHEVMATNASYGAILGGHGASLGGGAVFPLAIGNSVNVMHDGAIGIRAGDYNDIGGAKTAISSTASNHIFLIADNGVSINTNAPVAGRALNVNGSVEISGQFYGDGSGLTNLPAAATTAGVNQITYDGTNYSGDLTFEGSGVTASGSTFTFTDTDTGTILTTGGVAIATAIIGSGLAYDPATTTLTATATGGGSSSNVYTRTALSHDGTLNLSISNGAWQEIVVTAAVTVVFHGVGSGLSGEYNVMIRNPTPQTITWPTAGVWWAEGLSFSETAGSTWSTIGVLTENVGGTNATRVGRISGFVQ